MKKQLTMPENEKIDAMLDEMSKIRAACQKAGQCEDTIDLKLHTYVLSQVNEKMQK